MPRRLRIKSVLSLFGILSFAVWSAACSIPNLETPECTESRQTVKELYSYHFGNDMKFTNENLKAREKFLTPELNGFLQKFLTDSDPFTLSADVPRAFRLGSCRTVAPDKTEVQILVFWKDDTRSEQREIKVETVRQNGKWLVDNIYNNSTNLQQTLNHK